MSNIETIHLQVACNLACQVLFAVMQRHAVACSCQRASKLSTLTALSHVPERQWLSQLCCTGSPQRCHGRLYPCGRQACQAGPVHLDLQVGLPLHLLPAEQGAL